MLCQSHENPFTPQVALKRRNTMNEGNQEGTDDEGTQQNLLGTNRPMHQTQKKGEERNEIEGKKRQDIRLKKKKVERASDDRRNRSRRRTPKKRKKPPVSR
ncbi:hypothetical protein GOBAR_AA25305 [Gossypium barbadense]|uniref:Uncharacterized protein n=1 Tax=Gossypium barbadense TaxID=3634 RepID=A0A2P5WW95_GOSBA|nr:hypothetical protein GOBAR_AA25305 [Gossypium barbadense]